jgi:hypothetical protein
LIYDKKAENNDDFDSITIDANDIYKELKIRGYDYGPKFRGIQELTFDSFNKIHGKVLWTGNWVSFMDSLIQTQALVLPFRKMFVPVMISSLRCDPKVLFDAIEDSKQIVYEELNADKDSKTEKDLRNYCGGVDDLNEKLSEEKKLYSEEAMDSETQYEDVIKEFDTEKVPSIVNFYADIYLKTVVTHGIELKGLLAVPIPRKFTTQQLRLESYKFIPNEENDAIEEIDKKEITKYIKVLMIFIKFFN